MEVGRAKWGYINLKLKDIGRIQIARDLPVEDVSISISMIIATNLATPCFWFFLALSTVPARRLFYT